MWERLLEEPPSSFRDAALDHIKEQSRADDLAFSFLKDALNTVKEKMEFSSAEREKSLLQVTRFLFNHFMVLAVLDNNNYFIFMFWVKVLNTSYAS
ncbi:hypothetical protein Hanom_Chr12g01081521 [Helianthus anomalus]